MTRAFVDSRASFSIFDAEIADYLGLDYRTGDKIYPAGVGGHICAYPNDIVVALCGKEMHGEVLFSEEFTAKFNLLGRAGSFDIFVVRLDDQERKLYFYEKA